MLKLKCGDGLLFGFLILSSVGCTDRCFMSKTDKAPDSKSITKKEANPKPVGWPPESPTAVANRDGYARPMGGSGAQGTQGTTMAKGNDPIAIQPIGAYEKPGSDSGVIQAQRIETVPYTKDTKDTRGAAISPGSSGSPSASNSSGLMPSANPDMQKLPVFPENGAGQANKDNFSPPFTPSNSLSIPPPPPGSPLGGVTPLGIPTPPSANPNR